MKRAAWTGGILGAGVAFAALLILYAVIIGLQFRHYVNYLPVEARPFASMLQSLRRPLLGIYLYNSHLVTLQGSVSMKDIGLGSSGSGQGRVRIPLAGLLVFPALALTIGGYISARAVQSQTANEGARAGAWIAVPYAILLVISLPLLAVRLDGIPVPPESRTLMGVDRIPIELHLGPGFISLMIHGLLWGVLFGTIGGLWATGAGVRTVLRDALKLRLRNWAAGVYGACVALVLGLVVTAIAGLLIGAVEAGRAGLNRPVDMGGLPFRPATIDLLLGVVSAPPSVAVISYPLLHGVTGRLELDASGPASARGQAGISLATRDAWERGQVLGEQPEDQHARLPTWVFIGFLIPAVALVVGGKAAAGLAPGQPPSRVGLQLGLAYTLGLLVLWYFGQMGVWSSGTVTAVFGGVQSAHISLTAGPTFLGTVVAGLLWGAAFGTVGSWLSRAAQQRFCDTCGHRVQGGLMFCDQCGARVG